MNDTIIPDEFQQKAINWACMGTGNLLLEARAGSGKTRTIIESIERLPKRLDILYLAFNKSIAESASKKLENNYNVKVRTYHAQGLNLLNKYYHKSIGINQYKYVKYLTDNFSILSDGIYDTLTNYKKNRFKNNILTLFDFSRFNLAQNYKEIKSVADKYDINIMYNEIEIVIKLIEWGQDHIDEVDFPDMIWIPCEKNIEYPYEKYDFVFVDEVQDSSPCQQTLFLKCMKSNARCMMVGDPHQCINEWCGSDSKAFEHLGKLANTERMSLPISYRCSTNIIKTVNRIVTDIRPKPGAINGRSGYYIHPEELKNGDGVLCRNNEPLVRLYIRMIKSGKTAFILGKSLGKELKDMVKNADSENISMDLSHDGIIPRLYYNFFKEVKEYAVKNDIEFEDALFEKKFKNILDNIKAIESIAENAKSKDEFYNIIDNAFLDVNSSELHKIDYHDRITLSSIHKSKGLEFDRVYEACPSMCPSKLAKTPEELEAEDNLFYVCATRGKYDFGYIYETDLKPSMTWNTTNEEKCEINKIKEKVEMLYGPITVLKSQKKETCSKEKQNINNNKSMPVKNGRSVRFKKYI